MALFQAPEGWVSKRLAVGAALFVAYFIHYIFLLCGRLGKVNAPALEILQKRIHTFGIACLLSLSFFQASVFSAILSWFTLISLLLLHFTSVESMQMINGNKNGFWIAYYFLQFVWWIGIIVDFYQL